MRNLTPFICVLGLAAAVACRSPAPPVSDAAPAASSPGDPRAATVAPAAVQPRIVFLGDSLTAGLGLDREESVPARIQARVERAGYPHEVINAGVSGDTSAGGLNRLDWSLQGDVDVLVVELGANDGLRGLPVAAMQRNIDEIITRAKTRGITVLLTGMEAPPNYGAMYTSEFRRVFRDLAEHHQIPFVPFFLEGVAGIPSLNMSDGIHPNAEGARIIEANLWRALEPLLDE
jgi:acyl-CoA thioesterase-1